MALAVETCDGVEAASPRGPQLLEGWLQKCSRFWQQWHYRFVRLTEDGRLQTFTEKPGQGSGAANTLDEPVLGLSVAAVEFNRMPFGFTIATPSQTVRLAAETSALRGEWLRALRRAGARLGAGDLQREGPSAEASTAEGPRPAATGGEASAGAAPLPKQGPAAASPGEASPGAAPPPRRGPAAAPPKKAPPPPPPPKAKGAPKQAKQKAAPPKKASELPMGRKLLLSQAPGSPDVQAMHSDIKAEGVDLEALKDFFRRKDAPAEPVPKPKPGGQPEVVDLLPLDMARTISIHLRKDVDTKALAGSLERLAPDECPLEADDALRLVEVLPGEDVLRPIAAYGSRPGEDPERLRDVERQLRPLAQLSRLSQRLHLLRLSKSLGERLGDALAQMAALQAACDAVRCSGVFLDLLQVVLVLFNYVNFGEAPNVDHDGADEAVPRVHQVDVQSLMRLQETKAYGGPFPRYHMLHFCLQQLLRQRPELTRTDLKNELGMLPRAASLSLSQLQLGVTRLREDLAFARQELHGHSEEYAPIPEEQVADAGVPTPEEPEQVPAAQPAGSRVHFALEEQDAAMDESDEEDAVAMSSCSMLKARRGLLERLLGQAIDAFSFADAWKKGNAVLGRAEPHVEATLPDSGEAPPPGLLRRLRPSGQWRRYWCEVRASLLICYRVEGQGVLGTSYVVLPAAEVLPMDRMLMTGPKYPDGPQPHAFEVQPGNGGKPEAFCCQSAEEVWRWVDFLEVEAHRRGFGYLSLHKGGWHMPGFSWQRLFCVLVPREHRTTSSSGSQARPAGPRLLGFARPRDCAEGAPPERAWELEAVLVRALDSDGASADAQKLAGVAPIGLELEDFETGRCWRFACDSIAEQRAWLQAFDTHLGQEMRSGCSSPSGARPMRHTLHASFRDGPVAEVDRGQLFDLFSDANTPAAVPRSDFPASSDSTASGSQPVPVLSFRLNESGPGPPASGPLSLRTTDSGSSLVTEARSFPDQLIAGTGPTAEAKGMASSGGGSSACSSSSRPLDPALPPRVEDVQVMDEQPFHLGHADADAVATSPEPVPPPDALTQLRRLEEDMAGAVEQWGRTLAATESHCRALLRFFGLEAPTGPRLAPAAAQLLEALGAFESQVAAAWLDLERHGCSGGAPSLVPERRNSTSSAAPRAARGSGTAIVRRRKTAGDVAATGELPTDAGLCADRASETQQTDLG